MGATSRLVITEPEEPFAAVLRSNCPSSHSEPIYSPWASAALITASGMYCPSFSEWPGPPVGMDSFTPLLRIVAMGGSGVPAPRFSNWE